MAHIEPIELARYRDHEGVSDDLGAELREARMRCGYELDQVSEALRIRQRHLEAIEDGRFDDLPGRVYAIGFLRAYAEFVGLDPAVVANRFREQAEGATATPELHFPEPPAESWRPKLGLFGVALLLVVVSYGIWYYLETKNELLRERVAAVPEALVQGAEEIADAAVEVAMTAAPEESAPAAEEETIAEIASATPEEVAPDPSAAAETAAPVAAAEGAEPAVAEAEPEVTQAPEPAVAEAEPEVTPAPEPVGAWRGEETAPGASETITGARAAAPEAPTLIEDPPPPPVAPTGEYVPRVYGQANADSRVVVRALADSWIQVQGADNDLILTRILHPGDTFLAPNRGDLRLTTGNAGGLEVLVDGELMPPLGPRGAVRRDIPLSAEALTGGSAFEAR